MVDAKPLELPAKRGTVPGRMADSPPPPAPPGPPGAVPPDPGASSLGTGSPAPRSNRVNQRIYPYRTNGKVFFAAPSGGGGLDEFVCSATVVASPSKSTVVTAGHCVMGAHGWAKKWIFVPGYCGACAKRRRAPYGRFPFRRLFTTALWAKNHECQCAFAGDIGMVRLARNARGKKVERLVGAMGIAWNQGYNQHFHAFGYPAEKIPGVAYNGCCLFEADGWYESYESSEYGGPGAYTIAMAPNDMSGGSSGGGWLIAGGYLNGLNSYGYNGDNYRQYSPYYGPLAKDLYEYAN